MIDVEMPQMGESIVEGTLTRWLKKPGDKIEFNFAASSLLARQIEEGAPADIFFSADEAQMNTLEKKNLVARQTRRNRLSNSLAVVVAADSRIQIAAASDLTNSAIKRMALADPASSAPSNNTTSVG